MARAPLPTKILNYLLSEFRMTVRPNTVVPRCTHRRAGRLENRDQRWYLPSWIVHHPEGDIDAVLHWFLPSSLYFEASSPPHLMFDVIRGESSESILSSATRRR
jgi:hypothetical protein